MKIIHISDLHYGKFSGTDNLINHIITYYQNERVKPKIILSGDLVDSSLDKKDMGELKIKLKKLTSHDFDLMICPGNHDLKREGATGNPRRNLKVFNKYFKDLLPKGVNYKGEDDNDLLDYPIIHQFNDHFFIGLNSLEGKPIATRGKLGKNQLKELKNDLARIRKEHNDPKIIVYLHNNPFSFSYKYKWLKLVDRENFRKIIKDVNVLLSGHWHSNKRYGSEEKKYNINVIQITGASTAYNFISWTEIDTSDYSVKPIRIDDY